MAASCVGGRQKRTEGSVLSGGVPRAPEGFIASSSKRNAMRGQRTRVNRPVHPHSSSSPGAALGSVPTVALSSAQAPEVYDARLHDGRKQIDSCDGVDSRLRHANPCGSTPARRVPWTWPMARRVPDYGAARSPAGRSNRFYRCRADRARARMRLTIRGRPRRDGLRRGRMQKRTTGQTSRIKS